MNVTYFTGAGASYGACPILDELGECMYRTALVSLMELGYPVNEDGVDDGDKSVITINLELENPFEPNSLPHYLWNMGWYGLKANDFGTIDTYARRLHLLGSTSELWDLKDSVSLFFTIWQSTDESHLYSSKTGDVMKPSRYVKIDKRYIALLSVLLEKGKGAFPQLRKGVKFITWNYDLQIELAIQSFFPTGCNWQFVEGNIKYRRSDADISTLDICHLNGYCGHYDAGMQREETEFGYSHSRDLGDILHELKPTFEGSASRQCNRYKHITYAWENEDETSIRMRAQAEKIMSETDVLVVIGYSFPPFNRDVDKALFKSLKKGCQVVYQDNNDTRPLDYLLNKVDGNDAPGMKYDLNGEECIPDFFHIPLSF